MNVDAIEFPCCLFGCQSQSTSSPNFQICDFKKHQQKHKTNKMILLGRLQLLTLTTNKMTPTGHAGHLAGHAGVSTIADVIYASRVRHVIDDMQKADKGKIDSWNLTCW